MSENIARDPVQHHNIADDDIVIATLPDHRPALKHRAVDLSTDPGTVRSYDRAQRTWNWAKRPLPIRYRPMIAAVVSGQFDDTMHMIRHDRERVEHDVCIVPWDRIPMVVGDTPQFVQFHLLLNQLPEQRIPLMRAEGDEIKARCTIIVCTLPDRTAVMACRVEPRDLMDVHGDGNERGRRERISGDVNGYRAT